MAVGALSGGPKVKSRKRKLEVTPTKETTLQTVSKKAKGCSNGKSRKDSPLSQGSALSSSERTSRRTRTRQAREPCLASTPVHGSSTDRVPKILESPVRVNRETKRSAEVLTPLKVFDQILQLILIIFGLSPKASLPFSDVAMVVPVQRPDPESQCSGPTIRTRRRRIDYQQPKRASKRQTRAKTNGETSRVPAAGCRAKKQKLDNGAAAVQPFGRGRPRFNLELPEEAEKGSFCLTRTT